MAGILGRKGDMVQADIVTLTLTQAQTVNAGDALQFDGARGCKKFVGGTFAGFAVGDSAKDQWGQYDSVSVLQKGTIYVSATAAGTVNTAVGLSSTGTIATAATTTYPTKLVGSRFVEGATSGVTLIQIEGTATASL